ncbi:predicted protein [Chaetoceros tenuissimus]|uniref:PDZ domain-containing protein n=1 Tax=Chaetoceros tenuissimus TaxID=426638 RepID=A0AAD3CV07_9STRA|nr:predicted protein [Chaetoceros tenuissimus]
MYFHHNKGKRIFALLLGIGCVTATKWMDDANVIVTVRSKQKDQDNAQSRSTMLRGHELQRRYAFNVNERDLGSESSSSSKSSYSSISSSKEESSSKSSESCKSSDKSASSKSEASIKSNSQTSKSISESDSSKSKSKSDSSSKSISESDSSKSKSKSDSSSKSKSEKKIKCKKRKSDKKGSLSKSQSSKSIDDSADDSKSKKSKKEIIYCDELDTENIYDALIPGDIVHDISDGEEQPVEEDAIFESEASATDHSDIDTVAYNGVNPFEHDFDLANVVTEPNEEYETHRKPPNCPCFGSDDIDDVIGKLLSGRPYSYDADMTCTGGKIDGIEVFIEHSAGYKTMVGLGVSTFAQEDACHQGDQLIILKQEDSEICRRILARKCDEHKSKLAKAKATYSYL